MSFRRLLSLKPASLIEERFLFEMTEFCESKRCLADYFDFYIEETEDVTSIQTAIEFFNFTTEFLIFDEQIIYRPGMSECRIPPIKLLRIYNEKQDSRYSPNSKSY